MPQNPFYVHPGSDFSKGLAGLTDIVGQVGERKRTEEAKRAATEKFSKVKAGAVEAVQSGDPKTIRAYMLNNPEMTQAIQKTVDMKFPGESGEAYKNSLFAASLDFSKAPQVLKEMRTQFEKDGLDPQEIAELDKFESDMKNNPEQAKINIKNGFAMIADKDMWDRYQDMTGVGAKTTGKTYSKKNPDGSVRTIKNVKPGSDQEKQLISGQFVEGSQTVGAKLSAEERKQQRIEKATDKLTALATKDPNKFYEDHSYRQNKDGSLFIDPVTGGPQQLETFYKATGKRGNIKSIVGLGEQWDDAKELTELLELPSVQANLKKAESAGFWDQAKSKWSNAINKWMQDAGIKGDSPTATAIARIQRMASEERKLYMGTAVTDNEMRSALAWMPNAGDSFDSVMNKTRLMGQEAEQAFRRYVDVFEQAGADMSPFMSAFGIDKFGGPEEQADSIPTITTQEEYNNLPSGKIYIEDGQQYRKPE